jgi:dihydrofolate reductase
MSGSRVRVYIASSLDGFIAGPGDDLSWLPSPEEEEGEPEPAGGSPLSWDDFMADVGALLMGRRTWDVFLSFDVPWPWGERPVLVATSRPLDTPHPPLARAVRGDVRELIRLAKEAAGGRDVYLDGGDLIRQAAESDLIDDLTVTVAPVALGAGLPLFAGMSRPYPLEVVAHLDHPGGMVQLRMRPARR